MSTPFVFSNLPVELVRDILEHAALSDHATARNLTLVSSAVRHWTDPILYNTVVLSSARSLRAFLAAIANKPSDFVRTRVHNLGIFTVGPVQSIDRVLTACAGVRSLACGFSLPSYKQSQGVAALQSLAQPREQHLLGVACRDGWDASLVGPTVTHLRIHLTSFDSSRPDCPFAFSDGPGQDSGWARLKALPALTHLAVVYRPSGSTPPTTIIPHLARLFQSPTNEDGLPALELVLIQIVGARKDAAFFGGAVNALNDAAVSAGGPAHRIVAELAPQSAARQWEEAKRGGECLWDRAEAVVRSRLEKK
ncbi:hypothetical protein K466DRAFT_583622 [Polyporus arcularius HHB13444]|uniref:F-box domain-containing protein n=1 Tax=Polyporus arcularius HHB13444 TaxID=1314778 RepID=A0A5C3PNE8_9APHY|nr:hypothetical protein K466DRAFT_583622 [Polyporus arcularius HHB13444]